MKQKLKLLRDLIGLSGQKCGNISRTYTKKKRG
jgi:hypothetical protein